METYYFSFGQGHFHNIDGVIFDKDSICGIRANGSEEARTKMFEVFGKKWSMQYTKESLKIEYFPRGIISLGFEMCIDPDRCSIGESVCHGSCQLNSREEYD